MFSFPAQSWCAGEMVVISFNKAKSVPVRLLTVRLDFMVSSLTTNGPSYFLIQPRAIFQEVALMAWKMAFSTYLVAKLLHLKGITIKASI